MPTLISRVSIEIGLGIDVGGETKAIVSANESYPDHRVRKRKVSPDYLGRDRFRELARAWIPGQTILEHTNRNASSSR